MQTDTHIPLLSHTHVRVHKTDTHTSACAQDRHTHMHTFLFTHTQMHTQTDTIICMSTVSSITKHSEDLARLRLSFIIKLDKGDKTVTLCNQAHNHTIRSQRPRMDKDR